MKKYFFFLLIPVLLFSCKKTEQNNYPAFSSVIVDTLLQDSVSIRAIEIMNEQVWYAGSKGKYGFISLKDKKIFNGVIARDTLLPEFRSIALASKNVFLLSVSSPALLYKLDEEGKNNQLVYMETGKNVFYNSMQFFDSESGIAIGDPVENCLNILITRDGGNIWDKISCNDLPKTESGEGAFAASNTNIAIKNDKVWIASGGKKSNVYHSRDKGNTWEVFETPILQGREMTGIFSIDFYDENIGFAVGGDYENQEINSKNKIITADGGKTWQTIADDQDFGYASCVRFFPGSNGNALVVSSPSGIYYSNDRGSSWRKIYNAANIYTLKFLNNQTLIAAGKNKILRMVFN